MGEKLFFLSGEDNEKEMIPEDLLKDAYDTILEASDSMDYGAIEDIVRTVMEYKLEYEDKKRFEKINEALLQLDWDEIKKQIKGD